MNSSNQLFLGKFKTAPIPGYEDIHSDEPYIDAEFSSEVAYIHMFYVPPIMRGNGKGKKLFNDWVATLPVNVKRIKLKACTLGGSDGVIFWASLGFIQAYSGEVNEIVNTMTMGVNGYSTPVQECIDVFNEDRHWLEDINDKKHFLKNPQIKISK